MKNLFNPNDVSEIIKRIESLTPASQRQWGKMNAAQMLAHCNISLETAMDLHYVKPLFIGRIIGSMLRSKALSEKPFGKNSPTDKSYIFTGEHQLEEEKSKITASLKKFLEDGASQCTKHPHPFFGSFTPEEWAVFQWKHFDHHLRQFGV